MDDHLRAAPGEALLDNERPANERPADETRARGGASRPTNRSAAIQEVRFRALDLNLLRVFATLLDERNTVRAGERLGLTPSAISHALGRLRHVLQDELFARGAAGLEPTPRAAEIAPRLRIALLQLEEALTPARFVPNLTARRFVVASTDCWAVLLVPKLIARLSAEAPRASLVIRTPDMALAEDLDTGRIDLAVGWFRRIPEHLERETLSRETMVWIVRQDHPLALAEKLTHARLARLPHLVIGAAADEVHAVGGFVERHGLERFVTQDGPLDGAFGMRGPQRVASLTMPGVLGVAHVVAQSDMAALIPQRLAAAIGKFYPLKQLAPPHAAPACDVQMLWRRGRGDQPAISWFRGVLRAVVAEP